MASSRPGLNIEILDADSASRRPYSDKAMRPRKRTIIQVVGVILSRQEAGSISAVGMASLIHVAVVESPAKVASQTHRCLSIQVQSKTDVNQSLVASTAIPSPLRITSASSSQSNHLVMTHRTPSIGREAGTPLNRLQEHS
jgi:hypothetical protein